MGFKLKKQKYSWQHFWIIPLQCAPFATSAVMLQKLLTGLSAVFQVVVTAMFIDHAISAAQGEIEPAAVLPWLILLIALVGWRRVSFNIGLAFGAKAYIVLRARYVKRICS